MRLPILYSRTNTGAIQTWTIEVEKDSYRTQYGQLNGQIQTTEWTQCDYTNFGRANQRNPDEQAIFEANAMWTKKKDTGYFENIADIDKVLYISPMLANKWEDRKNKVKFPFFCQAKLDGVRSVITPNGAYSRKGKPFVAIPHILNAFKPVFEKYPGLIPDGELYNHDLKDDFNTMISLVKRSKPTEDDLKQSEKIVEFWWYDIVDPTMKFKDRSDLISKIMCEFKLWDSPIKVVGTYDIDCQGRLDELYEKFLDSGFEGQMVRFNTPYEFKRTNNLLKRKEFQDEEFEIIDVLEGDGNRAGSVGAMLLKCGTETFKSSLNGTLEYCTEVFRAKDQYIGKMATVKFFNYTPAPRTVPRFPKITSIRDYE